MQNACICSALCDIHKSPLLILKKQKVENNPLIVICQCNEENILKYYCYAVVPQGSSFDLIFWTYHIPKNDPKLHPVRSFWAHFAIIWMIEIPDCLEQNEVSTTIAPILSGFR